MFATCGADQFSKKFQLFLGFHLKRSSWFSTTIINHAHSFTQSQQRRTVRKVNRLASKSTKSVQKQDIDLPKVFMRDAITRISHTLRSSTWDSAQDQLIKLPIKWDSYTVNQVLKTHPPMEKAWLFFNWASKLKNFKHDQFTYTTMLDIFGEAGRISSMKYVFQQMQNKGIKIDAVTYTSLIHWISDHGDINESIKLWQDMKDKGFVPNVVCYTAYMKCLFDHNRVKEGAKIYKEMLQSGCSPNCHTYTVLMEHLASSGKFDGVLEIFSKMQDAGVQPDKASCNILVEKCCKAGETQAMMKILQYMKKNFLVLRYSVYQEASHALKMAGVSDRLLRDVNRHLSLQNLNQDSIDESDGIAESSCFTLDDRLILYLLNKKSLLAVDYLLDSLMNKCLKLDPRIVTTVVEVNCNCGRVNGAFLAFEFSVKLGITIERTTYLTMVGELIRTNSFSRAVDIVEAMVGAGLSLGSELTALLIHRLGCARQLASAEKLFSILPDQQKSTTVYTALINTYFTFGNVDKGLEIFETMRKQGINVALSTCSVILNGLERNGLFDKLQSYRKEKKRFQSESCGGKMSMEETLCDLLFAGNFDSRGQFS
ncbi:pentatricopeptide repeat-containing protein [Capsicum galapagoense]